MREGWIAWFARNPVAANLLMFLTIAGGVLGLGMVELSVLPEIEVEAISVTVPYPGASPEEVEEGICVRVEESIQGLDGVDRVRSSALEGVGTVMIETMTGFDRRKILDEVKSAVDRIDTFPDEAEEPVVSEVELDLQVLDVAVWGPSDDRGLRRVAERVRDGLTSLPEISLVRLSNARPYEISIEVSEPRLRRYGLSFDEVAAAVRRGSLDLPGGSIRSEGGEILLRAKGQAYSGAELAALPLRTLPDGQRLLLGDVAEVRDGFAETDQSGSLNGQPAVILSVYRVGDQDAIGIAKAARAFLEEEEERLPAGLHLTVVNDDTRILKDRLDLMIRNGRAGLLLVLVTLALFLKLRLALWVTIGIPLAFLGAFWLMPGLDVSVNMVSLFAFIVVLGIVVDDAIVVAENIHAHRQRGKDGLRAAIDGAREVGTPVIFAVLTTMAAFAPMLFNPGIMGQFSKIIPLIVLATLVFSLVESLWVLPAHLRHIPTDEEEAARKRRFRVPLWGVLQSAVTTALSAFLRSVYRPSLDWMLRWRYLTLAAASTTLLFTVGLLAGGHLKFEFFPDIEADNVVAELTMPLGTPASRTEQVVADLTAQAEVLRAELTDENGVSQIRNIISSVGGQPFKERQDRYSGITDAGASGGHLGEVNLELVPAEEREITSGEIKAMWQKRIGEVAGVTELTINVSITSTGEDINVMLRGPETDQLRAAAQELKSHLGSYAGVQEIADSFRQGKRELRFSMTPEGESLGLGLIDVARQVRQAYYGEEAQRVQRGRDDVKVMVRYPYEQRRSPASLRELRIRTNDGREVPLHTVARVTEARGDAVIQRTDRQRTVSVTASVDSTVANANEILAELEAEYLPALVERHRGVSTTFEGQKREETEFLQSLIRNSVLALVVMFGLLAVPLRSYFQPLIIMSAIPFGVVGAVWGHVIVGMQLVIFSIIGIVALSGVVVNDSLVMIDFINRARAEGLPVDQAVRESGVKRFRAILLTSLTTFVGLLPLLLEKSIQAQFIIPMAVSLGFGVLFATFITLVLVPCLYLVLEDLHVLVRRLSPAAREA